MSAPRYLSEPAAWREIARRIAEEGLRGAGLCAECVGLRRDERIGVSMWLGMQQRVRDHMIVDRLWLYAFPPDEADVRVLAALFLALEAESEQP